jgi:alpha-amylase
VGTFELKAWLSTDPTKIITRTYVIQEKQVDPPFSIPDFCTVDEGEMCAFFEAPVSWTGAIKCWAWDGKGNYTGGTWPGVACSFVGTSTRGGKVWKWSWDGNYTSTGATQPTGIIFSNNGSPQTKDLTFENGGYYMGDELKGNVITAVPTLHAAQGNTPAVYYNLKGQRIAKPTQKGLYIQNGKKMIVK